MLARQPASSAPLSLPFPINSTGLAQRAQQRETDAHGRAQSRHAAQHGDISARRQTVRIQTLTPLVRNRPRICHSFVACDAGGTQGGF